MNTRIALSAVSIFAALAIMGGATYAAFTDTASSQDNTFSTGSASLLISDSSDPGDDPVAYAENITGATFTGMFPGQVVEKDFWLKNDGSVALAATVDLEGESLGSAPDLKSVLTISFTCDADNNGIGIGADVTTPAKTVDQWLTDAAVGVDTIGASTGGSNALNENSDVDETACRMIGTVSAAAGNEISGETLSFDARFNGTQTP